MRGLAVGRVGALYSPPMSKAPCSRSARGFLNPFFNPPHHHNKEDTMKPITSGERMSRLKDYALGCVFGLAVFAGILIGGIAL